METKTVAGAPPYGLTVKLQNIPLPQARPRVEHVLKEQGFGILTEIDVQATLHRRLGVDFRPYVILGACNPQLAQRALAEELGVGQLLTCNVCLWQDGDSTVVSIADPHALFAMVRNPQLHAVADELAQRLRTAITVLDRAASR
jgi:uncharacterized protein (DUF302 family)